jgi:hypothetical protein
MNICLLFGLTPFALFTRCNLFEILEIPSILSILQPRHIHESIKYRMMKKTLENFTGSLLFRLASLHEGEQEFEKHRRAERGIPKHIAKIIIQIQSANRDPFGLSQKVKNKTVDHAAIAVPSNMGQMQ